MKREIWKDIRGFEGLYQVSNWGRVRSMWYGKIRILKLNKINKGYLHVCLWKDGKYKNFFVHRLVYEAFNGTITDGMQVNHIDEDKTNNRLENLNLMTCRENNNYGTRTQKAKEKLSQTVIQLTYPGLEFMCEWPSTCEAGRHGFNQSCVCDCCNGKRKSHKGVTFRYK